MKRIPLIVLLVASVGCTKKTTVPATGVVSEAQSTPASSTGCASGNVDVKTFGAVGDGVHDDTQAINQAFASAAASGAVVCEGPGTYLVSDTIVASASNSGSGPGVTVFTSISATKPMMVRPASATSHHTLAGFTLTRSVTPGLNAVGVDESQICSQCGIHDVTVEQQGIGFLFGPTDYSLGQNLIAQQNRNFGFLMENSTTSSNLQWYFTHILSQMNGADGFRVMGIPAAGLTAITMGIWSDVTTYANGGWGIVLAGATGLSLNGFFLQNAFIGSDNQGAIYMDTYQGVEIHISNASLELAGMSPAGPALSVPPSYAASGIVITASNSGIQLSGITIDGMSYVGLINNGTNTSLSNFTITNSGSSTLAGTTGPTQKSGIYVGGGNVNVSSGRISNPASTSAQVNWYGIYTAVDALFLNGVDLSASGIALSAALPLTLSSISGCLPTTINNH